jgi:hypothetical protein
MTTPRTPNRGGVIAPQILILPYRGCPVGRAMMVATITRAIRAKKVAVKRLAKKAGLADRAVTRRGW